MSETTPGHRRETDYPTPARSTQRPPETDDSFKTKVAWESVLIWVVIVAALALVAAAAVLLFLGLLELIAVVSPLLIAILLVWIAGLTIKTRKLENRLKGLEKPSDPGAHPEA